MKRRAIDFHTMLSMPNVGKYLQKLNLIKCCSIELIMCFENLGTLTEEIAREGGGVHKFREKKVKCWKIRKVFQLFRDKNNFKGESSSFCN